MKNSKLRRALMLLACAVLLVSLSVGATLAYLTAQDTVTNTFTVGKVAIKLDEAKANTDGTLVENADRVKANTYHLFPGHTYNKDPMVTVLEGSDPSYIKMVVTVSNAKELDKIFKDNSIALETVIQGYDASNWIRKSNTEDKTNNTRTYEFWYKETVSALNADVALDALFDQIVVPTSITNEQLATIANTTITVVAHAIQADGFTTAELAWAAYEAN